IAERVADLLCNLAEERHHALERRPVLLDLQRASDVGPGKRRPEVWWEQVLEAAPMHPRLHRPAMIDLDAPFKQAPQRDELEILVKHPLGKDQFSAPEALGNMGRAPPELLDARLVLRRPPVWRVHAPDRRAASIRPCADPCRAALGSPCPVRP